MNKKMRSVVLASALLLTELPGLPAFPGAEGYGSDTPGGRGGKVLLVTNLNSTGAGSLVQALQTTGPRIIVFRVSGPIQIQPAGTSGGWYMEAANLSYLTVAGQTSPGGITLTAPSTYGGDLINQYNQSKFTNAVWRFLRWRATANGNDAFGNHYSHNFIIDHCDFSGGGDETIDLSGCGDYTVQWSIASYSTPNGSGWGGIFNSNYGYPANYHFSIHHNISAHSKSRGTAFYFNSGPIEDSGRIDIRNNVIYNIETYNLSIVKQPGVTGLANSNVVNNFFKSGSQSQDNCNLINVVEGNGAYGYVSGNYADWTPGSCYPQPGMMNFSSRFAQVSTTPFAMPAVTTESAQDAYNSVLNKAGAWPRDSMANRTVKDVRTRGGQPYSISGVPLMTGGPTPPADNDSDGMADAWELSRGLNPGDVTDNIKDRDSDGYTNIEEYINCLADSLLGNPCKSASIEMQSPLRALEISVNPNPVRYLARVRGGREVFDLRGRLVANLSPGPDGSAFWNAGALPAGLYLLRAGGDGRQAVKRVAVTR